VVEIDYYSVDYGLIVELIYLGVEHDYHYFDQLLDNYAEEFLVEHLTWMLMVLHY
jgi:hypothetical protein